MAGVVYHRNRVWYGKSTTIIIEGGAGIVKVSFESGDPLHAYIHDLSVVETQRGCGLGNKLLQLAEEEAQQNENTVAVRLNVEKGRWAYDWYIRKGYVPFGKDGSLISLEKILQK